MRKRTSLSKAVETVNKVIGTDDIVTGRKCENLAIGLARDFISTTL